VEHRPELCQAEEHGQDFQRGGRNPGGGSDADEGENKDAAESNELHKCDVS